MEIYPITGKSKLQRFFNILRKLKKSALLGTSLLTAGIPFLCCWTPAILIGMAGFTGMSSNLEWLHPLRPFLFGVSFLSLGFAFFTIYKASKVKNSELIEDNGECGCNECTHSSTTNKLILWITTCLVIMMVVANYLIES